jgi:O-antigen/teichoic acid export membrane protein
MAGIFSTHRNWEDWFGIILGALIGLAPWIAGQQDSQIIMWNAVLIGAAVIALASLELTALQRWEEVAELLCGFWLLASPFALGYAESTLAAWHFSLGALLVLLAMTELWQDWHRSDVEMARHGQ